MTAFSRLHPSIRYLVREVLQFPALRPVQELTIGPVLDGRDAVVLAPTAGGKTEAAVLPAWSRVLSEGWTGTSILYICPLRALLNNQEPRLVRMAEAVGLRVGKWHGDVGLAERKKLLREPPHLMLITPESMEVLLIRPSGGAEVLLNQVRIAIVDEVHAFANDARGAHLVSILERLQLRVGRHIQRIGLSATVGNPQQLADWLQGSGADNPAVVVDPRGGRKRPQFTFDLGDGLGWAAARIAASGRHQKQLVFVQSRSRAEQLAAALGTSGIRVWVHHSSVGKTRRADAEAAFESENQATLIATSSMELGIDVGDLDEVIQLDSPATVSSLAQRLGRTGRRAGTEPRMSFLCDAPEDVLVSVALATLFESGWVEDVRPSTRHWTVLVHQILANLLETSGLTKGQLLARLRVVPAFSGFTPVEIEKLFAHLLNEGWLDEDNGVLLLGQRAEKQFGGKNFFSLYAVFDSPEQFAVCHGGDEVGTVQSWFLMQLGGVGAAFRLAGRAWQITEMDTAKGTVQVTSTVAADAPMWTGQPKAYSRKLCEQVLDLLVQGGSHAGCSALATGAIDSIRGSVSQLGLTAGARPVAVAAGKTVWHTYAGARINAVLARLLAQELGAKVTASNLSVKIASGSTRALEAVRTVQAQLATAREPPEDTWAEFDPARRSAMLSVFQGCLPPDAEQAFLRDALLDLEGARKWAAGITARG